jgi:hypothetical protein
MAGLDRPSTSSRRQAAAAGAKRAAQAGYVALKIMAPDALTRLRGRRPQATAITCIFPARACAIMAA